ncbi:MAG: hypothetical protein CL910_17660 [Deltaproteobacteria bacterium]|nr:hypothetical protein [Deltaproteobacteria bacterium]
MFRASFRVLVLLPVALGQGLPAAADPNDEPRPGDRVVQSDSLDFHDRIRAATWDPQADAAADRRARSELDAYRAFRAAEQQEADLAQRALWAAAQQANRDNDSFRHVYAKDSWHRADLRRLQEQISEAKRIRNLQKKDEALLAQFEDFSKELQRRWDELSPFHKLGKSGDELIALAAKTSREKAEIRRRIGSDEQKLAMLHAERRVRWLSDAEFPEFVPSSPFGPVQRTIGPTPSSVGQARPPAADPCLGPVHQRDAVRCHIETWSSPGGFLKGALGGGPAHREPEPARPPQGPIQLNIPSD